MDLRDSAVILYYVLVFFKVRFLKLRFGRDFHECVSAQKQKLCENTYKKIKTF